MIAKNFNILAGDVGGTNTRLAIFTFDGHQLHLDTQGRYPSASYPSLGAILEQFLNPSPRNLRAACLGIPGPIQKGKARTTNLPWTIEKTKLARAWNIPHFTIINDLAAQALGIAHLAPGDIITLQKGDAPAQGNQCLVSPGTGLGEAGLFWDGKTHHVWACEGGHTDFAPRNEVEIALLQYLIKRFGHVSVERVVSGTGLLNIYQFLRDTQPGPEKPSITTEIFSSSAPGQVISAYATTCPLCSKTIEIFLSSLAAEAGNMALKTMATGGVFIGGGIPPKILPLLQTPEFLENFNSKGRLTPLMQSMPVHVILSDETALLGAAHHALKNFT